jgi:hypothetical protein
MTDEQEKPEHLELPIHRSHVWPYLLSGHFMGAAFGCGIPESFFES